MRDTIGMAREVKATAYTNRHYPDRTTYTFGPEQLEAFADLVRADEREALGVLETDAHYIFNNPPGETSQDVRDVIEWYSAAIRARGNP
jgi:hypothetical protein